jgi:hypothetical protein
MRVSGTNDTVVKKTRAETVSRLAQGTAEQALADVKSSDLKCARAGDAVSSRQGSQGSISSDAKSAKGVQK